MTPPDPSHLSHLGFSGGEEMSLQPYKTMANVIVHLLNMAKPYSLRVKTTNGGKPLLLCYLYDIKAR